MALRLVVPVNKLVERVAEGIDGSTGDGRQWPLEGFVASVARCVSDGDRFAIVIGRPVKLVLRPQLQTGLHHNLMSVSDEM